MRNEPDRQCRPVAANYHFSCGASAAGATARPAHRRRGVHCLAMALAAAALLSACASETFPPPPPPPSAEALLPPVVAGAPDAPGCAADGMEDGALVGKTEAEAAALLQGCNWRIGQRDAQQFPGTMDFRQERRTLGVAGGIVIWVKRG